MKHYLLIVNPSGRLSACPTTEAFKAHSFVLTPQMKTFPVEMTDSLHAHLWANRDRAVIYGPGLPTPACLPGNFYYQVRDGVLVGAPQSAPESVALTADACIGKLCG